MTTRDDIHRKAGEALSLAHKLEQSLTAPIMMLFVIESGGASNDLSKQDVLRLVREDKARERPSVKIHVVDEKFQERMRQEKIAVQMLVRNGSMGELKRRLQNFLRTSPGGPPVSLTVLQDALEARNYLCHEFFKEFLGAGRRHVTSPRQPVRTAICRDAPASPLASAAASAGRPASRPVHACGPRSVRGSRPPRHGGRACEG